MAPMYRHRRCCQVYERGVTDVYLVVDLTLIGVIRFRERVAIPDEFDNRMIPYRLVRSYKIRCNFPRVAVVRILAEQTVTIVSVSA